MRRNWGWLLRWSLFVSLALCHMWIYGYCRLVTSMTWAIPSTCSVWCFTMFTSCPTQPVTPQFKWWKLRRQDTGLCFEPRQFPVTNLQLSIWHQISWGFTRKNSALALRKTQKRPSNFELSESFRLLDSRVTAPPPKWRPSVVVASRSASWRSGAQWKAEDGWKAYGSDKNTYI